MCQTVDYTPAVVSPAKQIRPKRKSKAEVQLAEARARICDLEEMLQTSDLELIETQNKLSLAGQLLGTAPPEGACRIQVVTDTGRYTITAQPGRTIFTKHDGTVYVVTPSSCTCPDHVHRHNHLCKHIRMLEAIKDRFR